MTRNKQGERPSDVKILSSLASDDSKRVFLACEKGIESSTKAIKELGLTQKRYYASLKKLIKAGLVEKRENVYVQTTLGKISHVLWKSFLHVLDNRNRLELADKLMKSDTLSKEEKERVLRAISKKDLLGTAGLADVIHEVKMIADYDDLIDEVIKLLDNAGESVYIAANKFDPRVMEASFKVIDKGLKFFFLSSEEAGLPESIRVLRMVLLDPDVARIVQGLVNLKELNVRVTKEHLSHSFIVVDGEYGIIELPHPVFQDFYVAFKFRNAFFCQNLQEAFISLYEKGKKDSRISFAKRFLIRTDRSKTRRHALPQAHTRALK